MVEGGTFDGKMNHGYSLRVDTLFTQSVNHIIRPSRIHFLLLEGSLKAFFPRKNLEFR